MVLGLFSLSGLHIGAVPDVTNNQVQVITTSKNLSTGDMEQFITYPIELEMANLPGSRRNTIRLKIWSLRGDHRI